MSLNIRRVGEVADGSVTSQKLALGSVDLGTDKVTGQLPEQKLENGAVTNAKLGELAVSTGKLQDSVVTLAKAHDDVKLKTYVGDESEVSVTGTTETEVKTFRVSKHLSKKFKPARLRILASLKTDNAASAATLSIYIDSEGTPRGTPMTSVATSYEIVSDEFDISDLGAGKHTISLKLKSAGAVDTAYSDFLDAFIIVEE